jgi:large subunit ribosomal protein L4
MINIDTYNLQGEKTGKIQLAENIFGVEINNDLIYQAVNAQLANARFHWAHTKDRSDVRGGGRKPWRQKGTGRARHGSIRSPLWRGGGIVFGPRNNRVFTRKINKKARKNALLMVLTSKLVDEELVVLEELKITEPKTKIMIQVLDKIKSLKSKLKNQNSFLIALASNDTNIIRASRNIPGIKTILANSLNVLDLLSFKYLLIDKQGIKIIEKTYGNI